MLAELIFEDCTLNDVTHLWNRRSFLGRLAGGTIALAGCGGVTYEERLAATRQYFEYLDRVNTALVPRSIKIDVVEVRVPKPFNQLLPPPPPKDDKSPPPQLAPADDPARLGYFPNIVLEGVLATWKASVRVEVPGNDNATAPAYLHLLCNLSRWNDKLLNPDIEPMNYHSELFNTLANAFNVKNDSPDEPWDWDSIRSFSPYVTRRKIESIHMPSLPNPPIDAVLYRHENKDVLVAFVLIVPRNLDPREKMEDKFKHTLELLKVDSQIPKKNAGPGQAPAVAF